MVYLPPPVWGLVYLIVMGALSAFYPWKSIADLTVLPLGIVLIVAGIATAVWAVRARAPPGPMPSAPPRPGW